MDNIADDLLSRYVLFSCEGTAEGVVIERLFESDKLIIAKERVVKDPITFKPYTRLRKAGDLEDRFFSQNYAVKGSEGLLLARIVDSRNAKFSLSRNGRDAAIVRSFITAPEIEMLVIHAEGAYDDWCRKARSNRQLTPSEYCVQHLGLREVKRGAFLQEYWSDGDKLVSAIRMHASKLGKRKSGELTLANLLK